MLKHGADDFGKFWNTMFVFPPGLFFVFGGFFVAGTVLKGLMEVIKYNKKDKKAEKLADKDVMNVEISKRDFNLPDPKWEGGEVVWEWPSGSSKIIDGAGMAHTLMKAYSVEKDAVEGVIKKCRAQLQRNMEARAKQWAIEAKAKNYSKTREKLYVEKQLKHVDFKLRGSSYDLEIALLPAGTTRTAIAQMQSAVRQIWNTEGTVSAEDVIRSTEMSEMAGEETTATDFTKMVDVRAVAAAVAEFVQMESRKEGMY